MVVVREEGGSSSGCGDDDVSWSGRGAEDGMGSGTVEGDSRPEDHGLNE